MELVLAIFLGLLFGFALNRVGATNPENIINMLRLNDLRLMKTILFAIGISSVLLFSGLAFGIIDPSHVSVKSAYVGVIVGGTILGLGFAIAGYCPGTGLTALSAGRKDALFFVLGGFLGAFIYMLSYEWLNTHTFLFNDIAGGATSLVETGNEKYQYILSGGLGKIIGLFIGAGFMVLAWILPRQILEN